MVKKSGPWFDPELENSLKKIALQGGIVTPSQVGLDLEKKKAGEKTALELKQPGFPTKLANDSPESLPGQPNQGRPKNSKDSTQRKTKKFSPQTGASLIIWATKAQEKINEIINPVFLEFYSKKNLRSLSSVQSEEAEITKTKILFSLEPFQKITKENILAAFSNIDKKEYQALLSEYQKWIKNLSTELDTQLSVDDQKQAKASFYSMVYSSI
jgi:hypothetical protein